MWFSYYFHWYPAIVGDLTLWEFDAHASMVDALKKAGKGA